MESLTPNVCPWCDAVAGGRVCPQCKGPTFDAVDAARDGDPMSGKVVEANRYRVLRFLGSGGMGAVYKGFDRISGRMVAIKFMSDTLGEDREELFARLDREACATARVEHSNVVRFVDFSRRADGVPFLVTEFLPGMDVAQYARTLGRPLLPTEAAWIGVEACKGLQAVHRHGFVHRDLKPQNIFLCADGQGVVTVKLLDFGVAKRMDLSGRILIPAAYMAGTFPYLAPELVDREATVASDLYALGVVLFELVAGKPPFHVAEGWPGANLLQMVERSRTPAPDLPDLAPDDRAIGAAIRDLLAPDPAARPASADAAAERLVAHAGAAAGDGLRAVRLPVAARTLAYLESPVAAQMPRSGEPMARDEAAPGPARNVAPAPRPVAPGPMPSPGLGGGEGGQRMLKSKPFLVIAGLALAAAGAFAAYHFLGRTSIADVKERCGDAPNRAVTVKGKVADTTEIPLVEFAFYQLDDGEDSIWVMTSREPPREGRDVKATGRALDRRAVERECGGREPDALCQALALGVGMVLGRCVLVEDRRE